MFAGRMVECYFLLIKTKLLLVQLQSLLLVLKKHIFAKKHNIFAKQHRIFAKKHVLVGKTYVFFAVWTPSAGNRTFKVTAGSFCTLGTGAQSGAAWARRSRSEGLRIFEDYFFVKKCILEFFRFCYFFGISSATVGSYAPNMRITILLFGHEEVGIYS